MRVLKSFNSASGNYLCYGVNEELFNAELLYRYKDKHIIPYSVIGYNLYLILKERREYNISSYTFDEEIVDVKSCNN